MKNINVAIRVVYFSCANNTDLRCKLISLSSDNHEKILWEKRITISSHKTRKHSKESALIRVLVVIAMAILWRLSNHAGKYKEALHTNKVAELINVVDINHWCLCRFIDTINTREVLKWSKVVCFLYFVGLTEWTVGVARYPVHEKHLSHTICRDNGIRLGKMWNGSLSVVWCSSQNGLFHA